MIMPHLRKQIDPQSFKIFSETAYWCTKEDRADRPYMDQVVKRLEKALEHQQKHENPVNLTSSNQFEGDLRQVETFGKFVGMNYLLNKESKGLFDETVLFSAEQIKAVE
ncbi:hypothetical protein Tco_1537774 [Tanacetum coccineum]